MPREPRAARPVGHLDEDVVPFTLTTLETIVSPGSILSLRLTGSAGTSSYQM